MLKSALFDTDVMVDFLRGHPKAVALLKSHASAVSLSSIVVAELYAGVKGDRELSILDDLIAICRVVPVTPEIARNGGLHKRDFAKSHGVGLADAIIAATVEAEHTKLMTLNVKHYPMLDDLEPPYRKS
ncbi:MAG: type II toxin-antitoxin system VapC family toxin [Acidobacteria bacterium]|nr:MAG: type II toxin-antitoxin system VapC family toxin [Acidobacteriota bacterium]RLE32290.1 MAG: type II toxin-antitoxin system VapC family toxin [Acidobacteriota bacterium]